MATGLVRRVKTRRPGSNEVPLSGRQWSAAPYSVRPHRWRTLHLVDVENLCGLEMPLEGHIRSTLDRYRTWMAVGELDQDILAVGRQTAFFAGRAWPGARCAFGHGNDGADLALLDRSNITHVMQRYNRVVLASGDHIFAPLVVEPLESRVDVTVVDATRSIARDLRLALPEIRHLAIPTETAEPLWSQWEGSRCQPVDRRAQMSRSRTRPVRHLCVATQKTARSAG